MKKLMLLVTFLFVLFAGINTWAEIREMPPLEEKKVETLVVFKTNWVKAPESEARVCYQTTAYWQLKKAGIGLDTANTPADNYLNLNPYLTYKIGQLPVQLVGGYWTDSTGADFVHGGAWLTPKIRNAKVFLEIREYAAVDGKFRDYLDNFLEVVYPVGKKFDAGINFTYDRQWSGKDRDFVQAGPILYYHAGKNLDLFVRPTRETGSVDKIRFGVKIVF